MDEGWEGDITIRIHISKLFVLRMKGKYDGFWLTEKCKVYSYHKVIIKSFQIFIKDN